MPIFSDLSNISHYYSGGSSSLNYLAGPYAGHSSIVASNYRTPPPVFNKPSSRVFTNRCYKPHLATITENQMTRSGLARINSPKILYHSSPKYKIQKPIAINTADIDVSSNRYRRNYERSPIPSPRTTTTTTKSTVAKSPERTASFKENKVEYDSPEDTEGLFMPRIDKKFRSTIKRERPVVRLHTIRNIDKLLDNDNKVEQDESQSKRERKQETMKIFDEEIKVQKPKWRENFEPDELEPNTSRKRTVPKPLSEKFVEKFIIKDNNNKIDDLSIKSKEEKKEAIEEILNDVNLSEKRPSLPKVPSFHDICKTISSDKIDEDLNPGQPIVRRNTRKLSNYDVLKAIRRNSAEINHEEIKVLDALIKEAHLDTKDESEQIKQNIENEDPVENDLRKRKKFTKKKSNEKLVEDEVKEEKAAPQRRKITKKRTTGSLDKAIEAITPKDLTEDNIELVNRKIVPRITGTVEIETVETKPNLKLVIDKIHVEETILSSSSPTTKKFKYNVIVEEILTPVVEKKDFFKSAIDEDDVKVLKSVDKLSSSKLDKVELKNIQKTSKLEEDLNKSNVVLNKKEIKCDEEKNKETINAEDEKQKMLDKLLSKKSEPIKDDQETQLEKEKKEIIKADEQKQKMLDKLLGKKPETTETQKIVPQEEKKVELKSDTQINKAEDEKQKMLDKLLGKKVDSIVVEKKVELEKEKAVETKTKAEEEKQKMLDKLLGKKPEPIVLEQKVEPEKKTAIDLKTKADEEKQKMLNKLMGKKPEPIVVEKKVESDKDKTVETKTKAEVEKQKMLDKLLGKKPETIVAENKIESDKETKTKAEEEKQKMLDKLLGKKLETIVVEKKVELETEKTIESKTKAEEEKQKMLDKILGKKPMQINEVEKDKKEPSIDLKTKVEDEKQKMSLLAKKPEPTETEKTEIKETPVNSKTKSEQDKQTILDKILDKKEPQNNKPLSPKTIDNQNKLKQSHSLPRVTDEPPQKQKTIIPSKFGQTANTNLEKAKSSAAVNRKKTLQKQENIDELTTDNFWDIIGKRETIYYSNRKKYLEERKEQEKKDTCWTPDEPANEVDPEPQHPYPITSDDILEKSRASDARLRQKLAEITDSIDSAEELSRKGLEDKIKDTLNSTDDKCKVNEKTSSILESVSNKLKTIEVKTPESSKLSIVSKPIEVKDKVKSVEEISIEIKAKEIKTKASESSKDKVKLIEEKVITEPLKTNETKAKDIKTKLPESPKDKIKLVEEKTITDSLKTVETKPKDIKTKALDSPKDKQKLVEDKMITEPSKTIETKAKDIKTKLPESPKDKIKLVEEKTITELLKTVETKPKDIKTKALDSPKDKLKLVEDKMITEPLKTVETNKPKILESHKDKVKPIVIKEKQKITKYPQKPKPTKLQHHQNSQKSSERSPKLSVKQKSVEETEKRKNRPYLKRQSKSFEFPNRETLKLTPLEISKMQAQVTEIKLEPLKPQLDFIIKDEFDPILKPNEDLIVPTASQYKKTNPPPLEEPPKPVLLAVPDQKVRPKPKQFDKCPVVIMATPRDLRKRNPVHRARPAPVPKVTYASDSDEDSDTSEEEDSATSSSSGGSDEYETNIVFENNQNANKWKSTSSNDSGFDSSAPGSPANKRNRNDAGSSSASTSSSDAAPGALTPASNPAFTLEPMEASSAYTAFQRSGRVTPPATSIPRFRKYMVEDFCFLKVLGKGSFGKVMLAELRNTEYYYAVKCLKKDIVLEDDDVECTLIERKVLALGTKHPYLCHLFCTFQTESHLFFVMEYLNGGDLMFHIQVSGRFPEPRARFYGAEIVSGLKFLHSKGIVYRDLKLDNILLDFDGHVRIADFGMCKLQIFLDRTADTFCGTPDYMAPEIIKGLHYNQGVDWWSFGVLLYEMLIGQSPFSGCDEDELFWSICNERPVIPGYLSKEASQILTLLLEKDSSLRLGNKYCPEGDIIYQSFFKSIEWDKLELRQLEAPFKPKVQHPLDTQYFDKAFTAEKVKLTPIEKDILHSMDQTQFHGFSYTNPNATDK